MASIQTKMINKTTRKTINNNDHSQRPSWLNSSLFNLQCYVISDRKQIQNVISSTEIVTNES